ncbi:hypothetical protein [Lacrimispora indolis]|uniref:hypothetical protein n=1 Tax=Lacrimispora indolis TaxID=69825 RepID=UPI0003F94BEE|nr:hypothetical protein [[Clostridium] methoxybenzovorans]
MSIRPKTTKMLSLSVQKYINPKNDPRIYWAAEVTFDYSTSHSVRVDFMKFKPVNNTVSGIEKGDFYCYEVKSSVEDFYSRNGHNFIGDFNYYIMPESVYETVKNEIPYKVGVLIPDGMNYHGEWYDLRSAKKAARKDRDRPSSEMLLMMFRSAARTLNKHKKDMNVITSDFAAYICDNLCKHPLEAGMTEEKLMEICCECKISEYIRDIMENVKN